MTKKTVAPVLLLRGDDSVRVGEISKRRKFQTDKKLALHNPGAHLCALHKLNLTFAVAHGMPRAGHSHTGRAMCTVVAELRLHIWKTPAFSKTAHPTNDLPPAIAAPSEGSTTPAAH